MGSNPTFRTEDYAERIEIFIKSHGEVSTEQILKEVKGTDFRLVDGLVHLVRLGSVTPIDDKYKIYWILAEDE